MFKLKFVCFVFLLSAFGAQAQLLNQRNWRASEKDSLNKVLNLLEENKPDQAFSFVQNIYFHHPFEEYLKYIYAKCALSFFDKHEEAFKKLNEIYSKNPKTIDIQFYLAQANYLLNHFETALTHVNFFIANPKASNDLKIKAEVLKKQINNARFYTLKPGNSSIENIGTAFNNASNQISPVININAQHLFYTDANLKTNKVYNTNNMTSLGTVYESKNQQEIFSLAEISKNFVKENARVVAMSADAQQVFLVKDNCGQLDIFVSILVNNQYTKPKKLKGNINSLYNENACSISPDGKTMFFTSNKPGGYGGYDIYRAKFNSDSTWTSVVNLGSAVNSTLDEDSPFIHANAQTLFFSSKGFDSMGGFDVFKSNFNILDFTFEKAENLGVPINSIGDDVGFVISANNEKAVLSSERRGGKGLMDLYQVEPHMKALKLSHCIVSGKVDLNGKSFVTKINVEKIDQNNPSSFDCLSNIKGDYVMVLATGYQYKLIVSAPGCAPKTLAMDLTGMKGYIEKTHDFKFTSSNDSIKGLQANQTNSFVAPLAIEEVQNSIVVKDENLKSNNFFNFQNIKTTGTSIGMREKNEQDVETTIITQKEPDLNLPFEAKTENLKRIEACCKKNGDVYKAGLLFKIQIAANKEDKPKSFQKIKHLGHIEKELTDDGLTRYYMGGPFNTYGDAFEFGKQMIDSGHTGIYIFGIYNGKRYKVEDLVAEGIFE
jgi:hypothetical protein